MISDSDLQDDVRNVGNAMLLLSIDFDLLSVSHLAELLSATNTVYTELFDLLGETAESALDEQGLVISTVYEGSANFIMPVVGVVAKFMVTALRDLQPLLDFGVSIGETVIAKYLYELLQNRTQPLRHPYVPQSLSKSFAYLIITIHTLRGGKGVTFTYHSRQDSDSVSVSYELKLE